MNTLTITEELKKEITDLWDKYHNYIVIAKHIKQKSNFNFYYSLNLTINLLKKMGNSNKQDYTKADDGKTWTKEFINCKK